MRKFNLSQKFGLFSAHWQPKIIAGLNDTHVKLVKLQGEFVWHAHALEDELFLVVKGELVIRLRDGEVHISEGELIVIPHGVEHCPLAAEEVWVLLLEPKTTLNTGDAGGERSVEPEWI